MGAAIALIAAVLVPFATGEYSRRAEARRALITARRVALDDALGILDARQAQASPPVWHQDPRTSAYQRSLIKIATFLDPKQSPVLDLLNRYEQAAAFEDLQRTAVVLSRWANGSRWWYAKRPIVEYLREVGNPKYRARRNTR